jgi:hypothetical protein
MEARPRRIHSEAGVPFCRQRCTPSEGFGRRTVQDHSWPVFGAESVELRPAGRGAIQRVNGFRLLHVEPLAVEPGFRTMWAQGGQLI